MSPFATKENSVPAQIVSAWEGGPQRLWSESKRGNGWIPLETGGFGGRYVCDGCELPSEGLYRVNAGTQEASLWLCADCRPRKGKKEGRL